MPCRGRHMHLGDPVRCEPHQASSMNHDITTSQVRSVFCSRISLFSNNPSFSPEILSYKSSKVTQGHQLNSYTHSHLPTTIHSHRHVVPRHRSCRPPPGHCSASICHLDSSAGNFLQQRYPTQDSNRRRQGHTQVGRPCRFGQTCRRHQHWRYSWRPLSLSQTQC